MIKIILYDEKDTLKVAKDLKDMFLFNYSNIATSKNSILVNSILLIVFAPSVISIVITDYEFTNKMSQILSKAFYKKRYAS